MHHARIPGPLANQHSCNVVIDAWQVFSAAAERVAAVDGGADRTRRFGGLSRWRRDVDAGGRPDAGRCFRIIGAADLGGEMKVAASGPWVRVRAHVLALLTLFAVFLGGTAPAWAQNKKNSWEVFLYFGGFFSNEVPSATQTGEVQTFRVEPSLAVDPNNLDEVYRPNLGLIGGNLPINGPNDPNYNYPFFNDVFAQFGMAPCLGQLSKPSPSDARAPFDDECDTDLEALWRYNASGIVTNGEIQKDDAEFTLGIRAGYNITRHWEVEFDVGFGKQRLDLTQNLVPLLTVSTNDISNPNAAALAKFYQFTWANRDYLYLVPGLSATGTGEHPNVISSRIAPDPNYNIPLYFPDRPLDNPAYIKPDGEVFDDVTGFINRALLDPTAFRNRGNQINIDTFTLAGSVNYNFNTKADSRIIPYISAGIGQWIRNFDSPYDGGNTGYFTYGGGIRFFVNEIFAFRADLRAVSYADDSFTITGGLKNVNLQDTQFITPLCYRDQDSISPPCTEFNPAEHVFPALNGGGGNASMEVEAELDDFFEFRIGFDVILGGS